MSEAIASQLSGGAGRFIDDTWPQRDSFRQNGAGVSTGIWSRGDRQNTQGVSINYTVNPNGGYNSGINGRSGATVGSTVAGAGNGISYAFQPWVVHCGLLGTGVSAAPPSLDGLDQFGAYRFMMLASFVNPPALLGSNVDNGMELCTVGAGTIDDGLILQKGTPGIGIRVYDNQKVEAIMRPTQAGVITRVDMLTAADGYQPGDWHAYEIRVVGAKGVQPAVAKFLIDGILKVTMQWGPGNIMPQTNVNYAGLRGSICSVAGNTNGFTVDQAVFHAAKNELNLL